jgi:cobalt/nickel transport system ATP-binding protein
MSAEGAPAVGAQGTLAPVLELCEVHYAFQAEIPALAGVSLTVMPGERIALLGANGAGKTTLLRLLAGLIFPQRGSYRAFGREVTERLLIHDPFGMYFRKEIGIVFQNADAQLFNPTVEDDTAFGPLQLGEPPDEVRRRTQEALETFRLQHLVRRPPFALSTGEKKKVALASVLVMEPQVLLLDEPTAGLDPRSSLTLLDLIAEAGRTGTTVLTATNDLHVVADLATRVIVLGEDRRVVRSGPPEEILKDREFLLASNLLHRHRHAHGTLWHEHPHGHPGGDHGHTHESEAPETR